MTLGGSSQKRVAGHGTGDKQMARSKTKVDWVVKTIFLSFLNALPRDAWLSEG